MDCRGSRRTVIVVVVVCCCRRGSRVSICCSRRACDRLSSLVRRVRDHPYACWRCQSVREGLRDRAQAQQLLQPLRAAVCSKARSMCCVHLTHTRRPPRHGDSVRHGERARCRSRARPRTTSYRSCRSVRRCLRDLHWFASFQTTRSVRRLPADRDARIGIRSIDRSRRERTHAVLIRQRAYRSRHGCYTCSHTSRPTPSTSRSISSPATQTRTCPRPSTTTGCVCAHARAQSSTTINALLTRLCPGRGCERRSAPLRDAVRANARGVRHRVRLPTGPRPSVAGTARASLLRYPAMWLTGECDAQSAQETNHDLKARLAVRAKLLCSHFTSTYQPAYRCHSLLVLLYTFARLVSSR